MEPQTAQGRTLEGLKELVTRQFAHNAARYRAGKGFGLEPAPGLWAALAQRLDPAFSSSPALASQLAAHFLFLARRFIHSQNQFIDLEKGQGRLLDALYAQHARALLALLAAPGRAPMEFEAALGVVLAGHAARLERFFVHLGLPETGVPAAEYSPALQMELMGVEQDDLEVGPVLDLGCGGSGALVCFLRAAGVRAFGLDRYAPAGDGFFQATWFDFDFGRARWGLITSHMAFSLHLGRARRLGSSRRQDFEDTLGRVLEGLKPGGSLVFAPDAPGLARLMEAGRFVYTGAGRAPYTRGRVKRLF